MFDSKLRVIKDTLLSPLVALLQPLDPLILTALGFALGLGAGFGALYGSLSLALVLWILNRLFDGLDGLVARRTGKTSWLGGYLDLLADFVIYAWIPIALVWGIEGSHAESFSGITSPNSTLWLALGFLLGGFYINGASWMLLSQRVEEISKQIQSSDPSPHRLTTFVMPRGIMEGFETLVFYILFFLLPNRLIELFWIAFGLTILSVVQRIGYAIKLSKNHPK